MTIKITTKTQVERIAVVSFLYSLGYRYDGVIFEDILDDKSDLYDKTFPHVLVDPDDYDSINFCNSECIDYDVSYNWTTQFKDIKNTLLKPTSITMEYLTKDYHATISSDGIAVGCQLITFEKFDELVELVSEFRAK